MLCKCAFRTRLIIEEGEGVCLDRGFAIGAGPFCLPKIRRVFSSPDLLLSMDYLLPSIVLVDKPFFALYLEAVMAKKENRFQSDLVKDLKSRFPGCVVLKNDPTYIQGFPDLTIFYRDKWAALECKRSADESHQPNQDYYVGMLNEMSYASFIFPENREEVLHELEQTFES